MRKWLGTGGDAPRKISSWKSSPRWPSAATWAFSALLAIGALLIDRLVLAGQGPADPAFHGFVGFVVLASLFAVAEALAIHIRIGQSAHSVSVVEAVLLVGLFNSAPSLLVCSQIVGSGLTLIVLRKQRSVKKLVFNLSSFAFESRLAALILYGLFQVTRVGGPSHWAMAYVAVVTYSVSGVFIVHMVIWLNDGPANRETLWSTLGIVLVSSALTTSSGVVAAILLDDRPAATVLVLVPVVGAYLTSQLWARERASAEERRLLLKSSDAMQHAEQSDAVLGGICEASANALHAQWVEVEVALDDAPRRVVVEGKRGAESRPTSADDSLVGYVTETTVLPPAVPGANPELLRRMQARGLGRAVAVPIRGRDGIVGVLLVGGQPSDTNVFSQNDVRLAETVAGQLGAFLTNAALEQSVAELRTLERRLVFELDHDALTGLLNRSSFQRVVSDSLDRRTDAERVAVICIDLDDFKAVNDTYGHAAGDRLLQFVAERLGGCLRSVDRGARLGGDEFAVVLPGVADSFVAHAIANRMLHAIQQAVLFDDGSTTTAGASIGVALSAADDTFDRLMARADVAMYRAKSAGKGSIDLIDPQLDEDSARTLTLASEFSYAVERDELDTLFQPVVDIATGAVMSAECLVRWNHPTLGVLEPSAFFSIIDSYDASRSIGEFVVRDTADALRRLFGAPSSDLDADFSIGVNMSASQFADESLVDRVLLLAGEERILQSLSIEVQEQAFVRSRDLAVQRATELRAIGVRLVLDDLSLDAIPVALLKRVAPTHVKLARSAVALLHDDLGRATIRALVVLGQQIGFEVVVKGVEDQRDADAATALGIRFAQGHFFGRPDSFGQLSQRLGGCDDAARDVSTLAVR